MDLPRIRHYLVYFKKFFERLATAQKNHSKTNRTNEVLSIFKGVAILAISILLAWMAKNQSEHNSRHLALNHEWPHRKVWESTLLQLGWKRLSSPPQEKGLGLDPAPLSDTPLIWISEDRCLIFINNSPYGDPERWGCSNGRIKPPKRRGWTKLGSGYQGLNLLAEIQFPKAKKAPSYIDPNEIRY